MSKIVSLDAYRKRKTEVEADRLEDVLIRFDHAIMSLYEVGLELVEITDKASLSVVDLEQLRKAIVRLGDDIGSLSVERERVHVVSLCRQTGTQITSGQDLERWIEDARVSLPELTGIDA